MPLVHAKEFWPHTVATADCAIIQQTTAYLSYVKRLYPCVYQKLTLLVVTILLEPIKNIKLVAVASFFSNVTNSCRPM